MKCGAAMMSGMDHSQHDMSGMAMASGMPMGSGPAGYGSAKPVTHDEVRMGPQVDMFAADAARYQLDDPGIGLRNNGRRVLTYADLFRLGNTDDPREPGREINLHLTGNMSRYMWSMNGIKFADAEPLQLKYGERVRINLINDTDDESPDSSARHVERPGDRRAGKDTAQAHGDRTTGRDAQLPGDGRCDGWLGLPLSSALSHARHVPQSRGQLRSTRNEEDTLWDGHADAVVDHYAGRQQDDPILAKVMINQLEVRSTDGPDPACSRPRHGSDRT